jgi:HSP20 family molecular chaperone IbpA
MPELKTTPPDRRPLPWLPSFDLHEQDGELVLHADLRGFDNESVEISLDGSDLIVQAEGESKPDAPVWYYSRLPLPFAPQALRVVSRPSHEGLEVHISPRKEPMNWAA